MDGHNAFPMVTATQAMAVAIQKARECGIAYVGVKGSSHYGAAGYYANMAADLDLIGISVTNTDPIMTVPGSSGRVFGTNPSPMRFPPARRSPYSWTSRSAPSPLQKSSPPETRANRYLTTG